MSVTLMTEIFRKKSLQPFKCPHCDKEFNRNRAYVHHLAFIHKIGEIKKYRCPFSGCDREYEIRESMRCHFNKSHLGIAKVKKNQKLICEQCGREFKNGYDLRV